MATRSVAWVRTGLAVLAGVLLVGAFAWPRADDGGASASSGDAVAAAGSSSTSPAPGPAIGDSTTVAPADTTTPTTVPAATTTVPTTAPASAPSVVVAAGAPVDPTWPKTLTLLTDSVALGAKDALTEELTAAGWTVDVQGIPALMVNKAEAQLREAGTPVGSVVVVALGYNSLWEKDRANFQKWSDRFDGHAEKLLATLSAVGAKKIVWVTLREPAVEIVPPKAMKQYRSYAWYFPYVNERLRALHERHPEVALADWTAVSNIAGITYDAIHLNPKGARLMVQTIRGAAGI